jgi:hypothetical protein
MGLQLLLLPVVSYQVWNLSREPSLHVKLVSSVNCVLRQTETRGLAEFSFPSGVLAHKPRSPSWSFYVKTNPKFEPS